MEAVWLSPVFESPMKDFGYDISNFTKIQDEYGTEEDLKMLLAEARKYGNYGIFLICNKKVS